MEEEQGSGLVFIILESSLVILNSDNNKFLNKMHDARNNEK